jgi:hypothetical protein
VHSEIARGAANQNTVVCTLTRRTECAITHLWLLQALLARISTQKDQIYRMLDFERVVLVKHATAAQSHLWLVRSRSWLHARC